MAALVGKALGLISAGTVFGATWLAAPSGSLHIQRDFCEVTVRTNDGVKTYPCDDPRSHFMGPDNSFALHHVGRLLALTITVVGSGLSECSLSDLDLDGKRPIAALPLKLTRKGDKVTATQEFYFKPLKRDKDIHLDMAESLGWSDGVRSDGTVMHTVLDVTSVAKHARTL